MVKYVNDESIVLANYMASPPKSPSTQDLARRRQHLRAQRRFKFYKTVWRSLAMVALATGTVWLATSPVWLIRSSEQLEIRGNQLLSDKNIQDLLPLPYPQSLLKVKPEFLAESVTAHEPIEKAAVSRRLIPPGLHIRIQERVPVAVAIPDTARPVKAIPTQPVPFREPGLIDAAGGWMPYNSFRKLGATASPPALIVKGMRAEYRLDWQQIYQSVSRSPVTITAIDWTRPSNLILQTELGAVYLGPYGQNFEAQLAALDQMRSLGSAINPEKVAFIDLHDPDHPVVEILQANNNPAGSP
ncbi:MAG: cell division protein FtsQ/DivIB [Phormidesmis sp.]